jgi:hypothetical protein
MIKSIFLAAAFLLSAPAFAADPNSTSAPVDANYTKAIEGRAADILKILALTDPHQVATVHDLIVAQYGALKAWHSANDSRLKSERADTNAVAQIRASLKTLHDRFLAGLAGQLSPAQIDQVKDKLTYGKVQFTFAGYRLQYPALTDADQQKILELLKQAREEAMDAGSAAEKTAVFQRYKGKINNYLSHQGLHPAKPGAPGLSNSMSP